jgi:hypothetical protein
MTEESNDGAGSAPHTDPACPACPAPRFAGQYTPELAARILGELETGRSLHSVCRDDGIPCYATVHGWVVRDVEAFAARYRRGARAIRYSTELGERILREIESGRSLHDVCHDEGMPSYSAARGWTAGLREFAARYHRARAIGNPRRGGEVLYTDAIAERVLTGLASGDTLHEICLDDVMPSESTVCKWVREDREGFAARYYAAREAGRGKAGRPTLYTPEIAERILSEVAAHLTCL